MNKEPNAPWEFSWGVFFYTWKIISEGIIYFYFMKVKLLKQLLTQILFVEFDSDNFNYIFVLKEKKAAEELSSLIFEEEIYLDFYSIFENGRVVVRLSATSDSFETFYLDIPANIDEETIETVLNFGNRQRSHSCSGKIAFIEKFREISMAFPIEMNLVNYKP